MSKARREELDDEKNICNLRRHITDLKVMETVGSGDEINDNDEAPYGLLPF